MLRYVTVKKGKTIYEGQRMSEDWCQMSEDGKKKEDMKTKIDNAKVTQNHKHYKHWVKDTEDEKRWKENLERKIGYTKLYMNLYKNKGKQI